jgi:hypothetical protein
MKHEEIRASRLESFKFRLRMKKDQSAFGTTPAAHAEGA